MSRYIDAEFEIDHYTSMTTHPTPDVSEKDKRDSLIILEALRRAKSIDIVHCRECKYASDNKVYGCMLNHFNDNDYDYHRMYADDFCSCGVKKGADDE